MDQHPLFGDSTLIRTLPPETHLFLWRPSRLVATETIEFAGWHAQTSGMGVAIDRRNTTLQQKDPPTAVGGSDPTAVQSPPDRATFFVTEFNTHKLVKTILERSGASFRHISTEDFLVSDDADFHPTDVIEDADGKIQAEPV